MKDNVLFIPNLQCNQKKNLGDGMGRRFFINNFNSIPEANSRKEAKMSNRGLSQKKTFLVITLSLLIGIGTIFAEGSRYLIITHDDFYSAIQPLKEWKHKKGITTKVVSVPSGITPAAIRDTIRKYQPEYVLLVGDTSRLPVGQTSPCISDNYYADTIGDYKAELAVGRFSCRTADECKTMVSKTLGYERNPFISDTLWYKKGTVAVRFDNEADTLGYYVSDMRFATTCMRDYAGFVVDSLFYRADSGWHNQGPDSARHIVNAINNGRSFLLFRGFGASDSQYHNWKKPMNVKPESTNNGFKLPIIFGGCCQTVFTPGDSGVGEAWLRVGTDTNPKGAVAYIGNPIHALAARIRTHMICGFFKSVFVYDSLTLGRAFLFGKDSLYRAALDSVTRYVEWNLLGDPELNLWTAVPQPLLVTHESIIPTGSQTFIVTVKEQNGQPLSNALVCVMMPNDSSVYEYGYTDEFGTIPLQINPKDSGWLYVTVTARNHIPYEDSCLVEPIGPDATGPNQGRHLARAPNSTELEWTFYANRSIFWQWMKEPTARLLTYIGKGKYPSIAKNKEGSAWISYTAGDSLNCFIRDNGGTWKKVNVALADSIGAPSLVLSVYPDQTGPLGYVVYMAKTDELGQCIHFSAFDSLGVYYHTVLDNGDVYEPAISITPKDLLHIVWRKDNRIYYITTIDGITPGYIREGGQPRWSEKVPISTRPPQRPTEPASNPFTETYGDFVYVTWRGPNEEGDSTKGDIWRRAKRITDSLWRTPENQSLTPNNESNFPVMSTNFVTVWQEQINDTNWDIWARFEPEPSSQPIFETPMSSKFPHIAGYWDPTSVIPTFICNAIWTEQIDTNHYEIRFGRYRYPSDAYDNSYYTVEIGDTSPSPYCIERDGFYQYGSHSVDYSNQGLKYQLPYLNPQYSYLLRAIIYRTGHNNWIEEFYTDSTLTATVLFEPNKPETVWFQLPKESYENTEVLQEIEKIVGSQALIADLRLYQTEVFEDSGGGGGAQSAGSFSFQSPKLYQSFPNPFKFRVNIRYELPVPSKVSLTIYDITGRAVRKLLDEVKEPGLHAIAWNGRDDRERILPQGIYFYRLKTNEFADTKRIILIR